MAETKGFPDGGVWDILRDDEVYCEFLKQNYDETTANQVAVGLNIAEHLRKLNECISLIDNEIHNQVAVHHGDLLSHATGIETLEDVLKMLHTRISSLLASLSRVKTRAGDAYARISCLTRQLARMQLTCDLMRKTARVLYLRRKLTSQIPSVGGVAVASETSIYDDPVSAGGSADLSSAAAHLFELKQLLSDEDLRGIDVIEEDRTLAKKAWKEVEARGMAILESGMSTPNQSQISSALQVFSNLDTVESVAVKVVGEAAEKIDKVASESLNLHNLVNASSASVVPGSVPGARVAGAPPGRAVMPIPGNVTAFRASLWTNLEKLMNTIFAEFQRIANLKMVVDQLNVAFDSKSESPPNKLEPGTVKLLKTCNIFKEFWVAVVESIGKHFQTASTASYVAAAFEAEFPKLLRFFNDLWSRVAKFQAAVGIGSGSSVETSRQVTYEEEMKEAALKRFRDAYLARALSRLLDPINLMFAPSDSEAEFPETPSTAEVENVIKALQQELVVSAFDETLVREVCEIISKCLRNFTAKCELMLVENDESKQVIGPANATQLSNAKVANSLFFFSEGIGKVLSSPSCASIPTIAMQIVCKANEELLTLMHSGILPLLKNIEEMIEKIILTMHNEDFSSPDQIQSKRTNSSPSSLYMRELNDFLSRVSSDYFGLFDCLEVLRSQELKRIATRTIQLFVRHAAMVRPLGDGGRMRLATDFAAFEAAISPLVAADSPRGGLASLGKPYRLLRACKTLLFADEDQFKEISKGGIVAGDLLLLFLFGRGPSDLRSPHQTMGWTEIRYSQWVDDHPQLCDRLELTRGALDAYQQLCRKKRVKEYATIYPLIVDLLNQFGESNS